MELMFQEEKMKFGKKFFTGIIRGTPFDRFHEAPFFMGHPVYIYIYILQGMRSDITH